MNNEQRTKKGFTIIELVTAVGLLALVISFAGLIFRVSIEGQRTAGANAEIMGRLRAITDQLNADFKGQIWNPQGKVNFHYDPNNNVRSDRIVFFANGDFQTSKQYEDTSDKEKTVVGNVACIFYGQAANPDPNIGKPEQKILVRRQTIITSDTSLKENYDLDDLREYCNTQSLADLIADPNIAMDELMKRPNWDPADLSEEDVVMYMAKGVDDFTIQYVGLDDTGKKFNDWRPDNSDINSDDWNNKYFTPLAFKFTFTLYDSKGVLQGGRTFTHIVYLGD